MNTEVIETIIKGGVSVILSIGLMVILYTAVKDDESEKQFLREHMDRQTAALERIVRLYSGEERAQ